MTGPVAGGVASGLDFTIEVDATRDLGINTDRVEAIITVRAHPAESAAPTARLAEVLIMDRSLSMQQHNKIHEARRAACAAIDTLPDGVLLGIVAGHRQAQSVFPEAGGLAVADAQVRAGAKHRVMSLLPEGGTCIGRWLVAADEAFATARGAGVIRHAVLYTDGKNEHENRAELDAALARCREKFTCDVRGLGEDWDYREVRHIADALGGDAEAIVNVTDLTGDFTRLMLRAAQLVVPRTSLRLRLYRSFEVVAVERVYPDRADLAAAQRAAGERTAEIPLGAWTAEPAERRYQVSLRFDPGVVPVGEELRAARADLDAELPDGTMESRANAPIAIVRHDTPEPTILPESLTRIHRQRDLTFLIQDCVDAVGEGRAADADRHLERALRLARELGDEKLPLLEGIAVVGAGGKVRLRPGVTRGELQRVGLYSTMTSFKLPGGLPHGGRAGVPAPPVPRRPCARCDEPAVDGDVYCTACGEPLEREAAP
jgi:Ca-activated chloride channel family protein